MCEAEKGEWLMRERSRHSSEQNKWISVRGFISTEFL